MLSMKKLFTEGFGTFFFTVAVGVTVDPIAVGFILIVLTYLAADISVAHFNPAVSLAAWIRNKINLPELTLYLSGQIAGAILGGLFVWWISTTTFLPQPDPATRTFQFIATELLFSFLFVLLFLQIMYPPSGKRNPVFGFLIGTGFAGCYLVSLNISGAGLNPAMNSGFAILEYINSGYGLQDLPIYILTPAIGAIAAAYAHRWISDD